MKSGIKSKEKIGVCHPWGGGTIEDFVNMPRFSLSVRLRLLHLPMLTHHHQEADRGGTQTEKTGDGWLSGGTCLWREWQDGRVPSAPSPFSSQRLPQPELLIVRAWEREERRGAGGRPQWAPETRGVGTQSPECGATSPTQLALAAGRQGRCLASREAVHAEFCKAPTPDQSFFFFC